MSQSLWAESAVPSRVAARNASPAAVRITPIHSRRVTVKPNSRSATTPSSTSPPAITVCTIEIGASASAATWKPHETMATAMPSSHQRERNRATVLDTGFFSEIGGDSTAPRCL